MNSRIYIVNLTIILYLESHFVGECSDGAAVCYMVDLDNMISHRLEVSLTNSALDEAAGDQAFADVIKIVKSFQKSLLAGPGDCASEIDEFACSLGCAPDYEKIILNIEELVQDKIGRCKSYAGFQSDLEVLKTSLAIESPQGK